MKKFISLALGLAFIGVAIQPLTEASRDAYHVYLMSQSDSKRTTYYRTQSRNIGTTTTEKKAKKYATTRGSARAYRNTRASQQSYYLKAKRSVVDNRAIRTFTTTSRAPWKNNKQPSLVKKTAQLSQFKYVTHRNDAFSLQLPTGYMVDEEVIHAYNFNEELEIRVKKFDKSVCELSYGFTQCAINLSKSENHAAIAGAGKITAAGSIVRRSKKSDTVLNSLGVQTDTYTEQFSAYFLDDEVYTLSRYMARDEDGGVYLIEIKVLQDKAQQYLGLDKKVFDSFRIYPEEITN